MSPADTRIGQKLANSSFVDKERARLAEQSTAIGNLQAQRQKIAAL
ncbi:hypothetical protein [Thiocapsa sp.]|nr:hypothetical protein [Thiocapsa sp.]HSO81759.1 hypothetical protein [Thiocapsa sp.]